MVKLKLDFSYWKSAAFIFLSSGLVTQTDIGANNRFSVFAIPVMIVML